MAFTVGEPTKFVEVTGRKKAREASSKYVLFGGHVAIKIGSWMYGEYILLFIVCFGIGNFAHISLDRFQHRFILIARLAGLTGSARPCQNQ